MCTDKLLKKISGKISRKLTSEEKDSKFVREETTAPLGLAIISITFTSNVINNNCLSNYESITIPTKVLIEKYDPKMSNYILLEPSYALRTSVRKLIQLKLKRSQGLNISTSSDLDTSNLITSDSNLDSSSTSSSEIEAIHKTKDIRKCLILKRKVKRKA
ncbi:8689_t:CDS:2 [Ambispora leptoticha]|uniref:8689_t:CDS:1 n=1 Tax=Ambispora leptoticha TaxID=144679 RepID=A0A9N8W2D8_9GLOM|nr:8689_t:CDS:2 [Ambispora leptoticha]